LTQTTVAPPPPEPLLRPILSPALGAVSFGLAGGAGLVLAGLLARQGLPVPAVMAEPGLAGWGLLGGATIAVYGLLTLAGWRRARSPSLDDLPEAVFVLDDRGRMLRWNHRAEDLAGDSLGWRGLPFVETAVADDHVALGAAITAALRDGAAKLTLRLRTAEGVSLTCDALLSKLDSRKSGLVVVLRDISAERAADQQREERQGSFVQMVEMAPHLVAVVIDGKISWANPAGLRLLGADQLRAVAGRAWSDFFTPGQHDGDHLRRLDGREVPVELTTAPTLYDGRPATIVEARDVSLLRDAMVALNDNEQRLHGVMDAQSDAVLIADGDGTVLAINPAGEAMFGYPARDLVGQNIALLIPDENRDSHATGLLRFQSSGERGLQPLRDVRAVRRDGSSMPVSVSLVATRGTGRPLFAAVVRDLSERKAMHSRLSMAEKVLESTSEGVMVSDASARILWVNSGFTRISGYSRDEVLGKTANVLKSGLQGPAFYQAMWADLTNLGEWSGEIWNRRKDGEAFPEWLTIKAVRDEAGTVDRYVGVFSDISKHKRAEETIRHLTYYDPVTRLPNRYLFQDRITQGMERARRAERQVALVLVSLDRFKTVNETLGHQVGDALLREVAQRLTNSVRAEDTVSRLRGDTFCCVLSELLHIHDANPVINRILECFGLPFIIAEHELFVTSSVGISLFPLDGTEIDDLLQKAETAMNRSKERADSTYHFYTPEMNANSMERLRLETDLRKAINRGELLLYYQPKVETTTGKLVGSEALIRWRHPEYGMVPPGRFIPIAEDTGLIVPIGAHVLQTACEQVRSWITEGLTPVKVAVNLSAHQFRQPNLVEMIQDILDSTGVPPHLIELELTESSVMRNADAAVLTLRKLHDLGLSIAIDDFGTGYSSLSYLKKFPIDRLKVDRSFVQDLGQVKSGEEIVGAIIAMAHSLKMQVVAEGVETNLQHGMLNELRCDEIQGYFYSRPVPAEEFGKLLAQGILTGTEDTLP
jgi:diguanylate cyclase (GGDEF)-like protein/PAS domain S-box-containing protein